MKVSPNCRTRKSGMICTILESFCSFLDWEGVEIRPKIWSRKIPVKSPQQKGLYAILYLLQGKSQSNGHALPVPDEGNANNNAKPMPSPKQPKQPAKQQQSVPTKVKQQPQVQEQSKKVR